VLRARAALGVRRHANTYLYTKTPHIVAQKSHPVDSPKGSFSSTPHGLLGVFLVDLLERQVYGSHIKMTSVREGGAVQQPWREAQPPGSLAV
jgi:hypothetical protein